MKKRLANIFGAKISVIFLRRALNYIFHGVFFSMKTGMAHLLTNSFQTQIMQAHHSG